MIYCNKTELLEKAGVSEKTFQEWENILTITPITDTDGTLLYPMSWINIFQQIKADPDNWRGFELNYWSVDEALPRLQMLFEKENINYDKPDATQVWEIYKRFLREPILDAHYNTSHDFVEGGCYQNEGLTLHLIRQFKYYNPDLPPEMAYDHMDQLTIILTFESGDPGKKDIDLLIWPAPLDEFIQEIETHKGFKQLLSYKTMACRIEQITQ